MNLHGGLLLDSYLGALAFCPLKLLLYLVYRTEVNGDLPLNKTKNGAYSKRGIILLCCMVYFVSYFSRKDFAAVMAGMLAENIMSRSTAGLIGTVMFVCYGTGQLISGYLGDKIKPKHLIITGLMTTGVCNALMPLLPEWAMIVAWGVNGLAQAMLWPPIIKILSSHLDHKTYVTANLAVTSAAYAATILLYVYVPICLSFMKWSTVFFTASAIAVLSALVFAIALRIILPENGEGKCDGKIDTSPTQTSENKAKCERSILSVLKESGVITIFVCIIVCGFLRDGIESWLPTLYSEVFGRDASESILVSVVLPIFSIVSITVVTALHKRRIFNNEISGSAILFGIALLCALPLMLLVQLDGVFFGVLSLLLTAFICGTMHGVNFLLISCLPGRFTKTGKPATVSGICNSCVYIGAAISMYGIAIVSESLGWSFTVFTWMLLSALGIVFALISYRKYTNMIKDNNTKE